jgi:hypothetical protein
VDVTAAHGEAEIWVRESDGADRTVLTQLAFSPGTGSQFMDPALSPNGDRLAFTQLPGAGLGAIWITSVAEGTPVRLTNDSGAGIHGRVVAGRFTNCVSSPQRGALLTFGRENERAGFANRSWSMSLQWSIALAFARLVADWGVDRLFRPIGLGPDLA